MRRFWARVNYPFERYCVRYCMRRRKGIEAGRFESLCFKVIGAIEFWTRKKRSNGGYSYNKAPNA